MQNSIHIYRPFHIDNWRPVELSDVTLVEMKCCPCCAGALETVVLIESDQGDKRMRVGACDTCGYVGYVDKPAQEWIEHFYDTAWDTASKKTLTNIRPFSASPMIDWILEVADTKASVFEVGTGYGQNLKLLAEKKFTALFGVENSPHRAELASAYAGAQVFHEAFGQGGALEKAGKQAPYDVIYSKSVMEHMYDPNDLFANAKKLQKTDGYVIVAVPHIHHEPALNTILFLPHLHGFTPDALKALALKHGYVPEKVESVGKGLFMRARLNEQEAARITPSFSNGYVATMTDLFHTRLHTKQITHARTQRVLWNSLKDPNKHDLIGSSVRILNDMYFLIFAILSLFPTRIKVVAARVLFGISKRNFSFVISRSKKKRTTAPITIVTKRLTVYYK